MTHFGRCSPHQGAITMLSPYQLPNPPPLSLMLRPTVLLRTHRNPPLQILSPRTIKPHKNLGVLASWRLGVLASWRLGGFVPKKPWCPGGFVPLIFLGGP